MTERNDFEAVSPSLLAKREVEALEEHAQTDRSGNEPLATSQITRVYHCFTCGTHVDPQLGVNYVPVNEPVNSYRRRKIAKRNRVVAALNTWLVEALRSTTDHEQVQSELRRRQQYVVVDLALNSIEAESILTRLFGDDWLHPGCLEGGYFEFVDDSTILYLWEEGIPCSGGITDRYYAAEIEKQDGPS